jgi:hypothetical protein
VLEKFKKSKNIRHVLYRGQSPVVGLVLVGEIKLIVMGVRNNACLYTCGQCGVNRSKLTMEKEFLCLHKKKPDAKRAK